MTDALVIQDLRKVYASGVEALRGIDLTVDEDWVSAAGV